MRDDTSIYSREYHINLLKQKIFLSVSENSYSLVFTLRISDERLRSVLVAGLDENEGKDPRPPLSGRVLYS